MRALITTAVVILVLALTGPVRAEVLTYQVTQPSAAGPPYPAPPITFDVFHPPNPIHVLAVQLFDASFPPVPVTPLPLLLRGSDDGRTGQIAFLPAVPPAVFHPPVPIRFDVFFDLRPHPDAPTPLQVVYPPNPIVPGDGFFDVFFEVLGGGTASHVARFEIGASQPLEFVNVQLGPPEGPAFHLTFDLALERPGAVPLNAALFDLRLQGEFTAVPEPASLVLLGSGVAGLLGYGWWRRGGRTNRCT